MLKTSLLVALSAFLQIFDPNLLLLCTLLLLILHNYISITDTISILHLLPLLYIIYYELQVYLIVITTKIVDECL